MQESRNRLTILLDTIDNTYLGALQANAIAQIRYRREILRGRINSNDLVIAAEIDRLEKERLRLLAEAEAARLEAIRVAEAERAAQSAAIARAAAEEEERQRQIQVTMANQERDRIARENDANNFLVALAICFYTGYCR